MFDYTLAIRKTPIVVNDSRGFFTSRVIGTFVNEAIAMLGEGIEPATIEQAGSQAGYPAPPLQLTDELNLKLMQKIAKETAEAAKQGDTKMGATRHPALDVIDWMVDAGSSGSSGEGRLLRVRRERQASSASGRACAISSRPSRP